MMGSDEEGQPAQNPAFTANIRWRVFNEELFPKRSGSSVVIAGGVATGKTSYDIPEHLTLTVSAVVGGRERVDEVNVSRSELESVRADRTYETSSGGFVGRLAGWVGTWAIALVLALITILNLEIFFFIAFIAVAFVSAPFAAKASIDFAWWAGHGFASETMARRIATSVLLAADIVPLVYLQIRVG